MWGKGELKLSKQSMEHLMMYMYGAGNTEYSWTSKKKNKPDVFAVSKDGKSSFYMYCPYSQCMDPNLPQVIKSCEKNSNGSPCNIMALKRRIVWKNGGSKIKIKKSMLKDPVSVAQAIKDGGFYDGEISKLAGIDYKTGLKTSKKITGKQDNYDYPLLISDLPIDTKDSWRNYVEGGEEKYKAWVMAKQSDGGMTYGWEANNISWKDVTKKAFDRCNKYVTSKPNKYPYDAICILYYKGTTPTNPDEKVSSAINYYGANKASSFLSDNLHLIDNRKDLLTVKKVEQSSKDPVKQLKSLKELLDAGVINKEEFEKLKKNILN